MHSSPSFSGAPHSFAPLAGPLLHNPQSFRNGQAGHWPSNAQRRPYTRNGVGYRRPYLYAGYPGLIGYGLLPWGLSNGDDQDYAQQPDYGNQPPVSDYAPEPSGPQLAENAPSPFRPTYPAVQAEPAVHIQPATTLIFNDGRPSVQVHNYAITGSTLYALDDGARQEIPLSQLNVPATVQANRQAGVDFALPISH